MDNNYIDKVFMEARMGDKEKLTELFLCFKNYIDKKACCYYIKGYDTEDLVSLGNLTLLKAYNSFDSSKCSHFAHYACSAIKNNFNYCYRSAKMRSTISISSLIHDTSLEDKLNDSAVLDEYLTRFNNSEMKKAVLKLEPELFDIISHVYYKDRTIMEYAKINNISYNKARRLRLKAEKKLRNLLSEII